MVTRIRQLLEHKQLTPTQFADLIGVGRPVMSHILSERNKPSLEVVQRIISAFPELSLPWLLSGTGDMLGGQAPASALSGTPEPVKTAEPAPVAPPAPVEAAEVPPTEPVLPAEPQDAPSAAPVAAPSPPAAAASTPVAAAAPSNPSVTPAPKPFRAGALRKEATASTAMPPTMAPVAPVQPLAPPAPLASTELAVPPVPAVPAPGPVSTAPVVAPAPAASEAALLPFLAEPGKAIRRIVIFYRDGSFADYQPEQ